ncbi:glycosyltransferase family 2 protein [Nitratidesulfovibrio termitidis]|uniref:glycosyltransferase family 2 protein n=1 Tax=Nitratidesulfovibrio termitidis TaxID=42252 RepID=UPI000428C9F2|nr:glycosyltransferase [Nitratidesulfovibrio termitidis]
MAHPHGIPAPHPAQAAALLATLMDRVPLWECGAMGADNQFRLARGAIENAGGDPGVVAAGVGMALWGWRDNPLDTRLAALLRAIMEDAPQAFAPALRELVTGVHDRVRVPDDFGALDATLNQHGGPAAAPAQAMLDVVLPRLADPAHGLFWLARGVEWCVRHENSVVPTTDGTAQLTSPALPVADDATLETLLRAALSTPLPLPETVARRLRAEWAVRRLDAAEALRRLEQLAEQDAAPEGASPFAPWYALRRAELLIQLDSSNRQGHAADAAALLLPLWRETPYHPNLTLALHDLLYPLPAPPADAAPPAILLYTWNKRDLAAQTLRSLRTAGFRGAPVFALDNGSQDGTEDMFRTMAADWGSPFSVVRLPVNVGAPAARNWLLSLPEVRQRDHAVFLDDDVLLNPGWLDGLLAVAHTRPGWGAIGCAVTDHTPPHALQCADFFTLPPDMGTRSFADLDEHWHIHGNAAGSADTLLTAYTRPCLSVSGCCHMVSMASVQQVGAFDVRFTPSQFDDLERDIRCTLAGLPVWYAGTVRVRHMQHSSLRQATSRARSAHIFGNRIKLEHLHPANKARQAREASAALARQDLLRKTAALAAHDAP